MTGALLVMVGGYRQSAGYDRALAPLTNRVTVYLGDISYSMYLWHFPVLILALSFLPVGPVYFVVTLGATLALSALSYHFIEDPIRHASWPKPARHPSKWKPVVFATGAVAIVACVVGATIITTNRQLEADAAAAATAQLELDAERAAASGTLDESALMAQRCAGAGSLREDALPCDLAEIPLSPSLASFQDDVGSDSDLACRRTETGPPVSCDIGDTTSEYHVALIGDSHAGHYLPVLRKLATDNGWHLTTFIGWNCQWTQREANNCGAQIDIANAAFASGEYDLVISGASRKITSQMGAGQVDAAAGMMRDALSSGTRVVYIEDAPLPSEESLLCIQRPGFDPLTSSCGTPASEGFAVTDTFVDAARTAGAEVVSFNDTICPSQDFCPSVVGKVITLRDTAGHLTTKFTTSLKPFILERIFTDAPVTTPSS